MLPLSRIVAIVVVICSRRAFAQMIPTIPGPGETYRAGLNCTIAWNPDTSGVWTNVSIDLMSGSNNNMSLVTNVITGLDGIDPSLTPFNWTCPEVNPYSAIYFYQVTNGDDISSRTWTTRFTIASPDNDAELPENPLQPNGEHIPWGIGSLSNKSTTNATRVDRPRPSDATHSWPSGSPSSLPFDRNRTHSRDGEHSFSRTRSAYSYSGTRSGGPHATDVPRNSKNDGDNLQSSSPASEEQAQSSLSDESRAYEDSGEAVAADSVRESACQCGFGNAQRASEASGSQSKVSDTITSVVPLMIIALVVNYL